MFVLVSTIVVLSHTISSPVYIIHCESKVSAHGSGSGHAGVPCAHGGGVGIPVSHPQVIGLVFPHLEQFMSYNIGAVNSIVSNGQVTVGVLNLILTLYVPYDGVVNVPFIATVAVPGKV